METNWTRRDQWNQEKRTSEIRRWRQADQEKGRVGPGGKDKRDQEIRTSGWTGDKREEETSGTRRGDQNNQEMGTSVTRRGDQDRGPHALQMPGRFGGGMS